VIRARTASKIEADTTVLQQITAIKSNPPMWGYRRIWGMDMTKVKSPSFGWVYLHIVLDWYTKEIVGYSFSFQSKTEDWLNALNMAVNFRYKNGILNEKTPPKLITDNRCQPTSERFARSTSEINIKQIFTSWNNTKGDADTERVMRTIKEDIIWPHDWHSTFEFESAFKHWVIQYNTDFPHQTLRYKTPAQFMRECSLENQEV
jgi:putative transposase